MQMQIKYLQLLARSMTRPASSSEACLEGSPARQVTIEWVRRKRLIRRYRYFMFLNSSVRGPFYPSYQPRGWSWPRAFTDRLGADVKVVASSIVCLPQMDAGGLGPKARRSALGSRGTAVQRCT